MPQSVDPSPRMHRVATDVMVDLRRVRPVQFPLFSCARWGAAVPSDAFQEPFSSFPNAIIIRLPIPIRIIPIACRFYLLLMPCLLTPLPRFLTA